MTSTPVHPDSSPAADLQGWYEVQRAAHVHDRPRLMVPSERYAIDLLRPDPGRVRTTGLFRDEYGVPTATALLDLWSVPQLRHLAVLEVVVRPHFRRRGIGRRIVERLAASATDLGRETLVTRAVGGSDGAAFCAAAGFAPVLERIDAVLEMRAVAPAALDRRAVPGYGSEAWTGRCPDRLLDGYAAALGALQDQPLGDLDLRRRYQVSPAAVRATEGVLEARHQRRHVLCAREERSGELVGVTCVDVHQQFPQATQGPTAVAPAHRGRGLARWLKAAMAARLAECEPHVTRIRTTTAIENAAIRRVNAELGFREVLGVVEFQRRLSPA